MESLLYKKAYQKSKAGATWSNKYNTSKDNKSKISLTFLMGVWTHNASHK